MRVLALDMATATGWATNQHDRIESGVQRFDLKRGESLGMRWVRFNTWLRNWEPSRFTPEEQIRLVVYEQNFRRGGAATEVAAGFATRVHEFCAQHGIEHTSVNVHELKKFTCGHAGKKADKAAMWVAASKKGWLNHCAAPNKEEVDDNEVDALCLLHYALEETLGGK